MSGFDPSAVGSDVARSRKQYYSRKFADFLIALLGLNKPSFVATEIVQKIAPVCTLNTKAGDVFCRGGHGRLLWRVDSFYSEEPETIKWLDALKPDDILYDIGANVGLYSLYAAKVAGCKVISFEPEAQNYAIFLENIALNPGFAKLIEASNIALNDKTGLGRLMVHAMTKGGAYNQFFAENNDNKAAICQLGMGFSLDDFVTGFDCPFPTHIKIDVDGIEPQIIEGAGKVLQDSRCKSLLIELRTDIPEHIGVVDRMLSFGFVEQSRRSNWDSRTNREREGEYPASNFIFVKP